MNIITIGKITLGALAINGFIEREMNNPSIETYKPIDTVSIIIPSFNEEKFIQKSLSSIKGQSILNEYPEFFETILVDSGSTDNTVNIAESYVDRIITTTKRGKLIARNIATLQSKGNIIVSVDSDSYYPPHWLNTLLEPFNNITSPQYDSNIVGVVGSTYDKNIPYIPTTIRNYAEIIDRMIINTNQMVGRNSAYYKHIFYTIGFFNESINQQNIKEMLQEEEKGFGERLSRIGKIKFKLSANCIHLGGQRIGCRIGTTNKEYCTSQGISIKRFG